MSVESSSLPESLCHDQRQRWLSGDRVLVESYLERHPELSHDAPALLLLIESEYCVRLELGELPSVDEYVQRFPELSGEVSRRLTDLPKPPRASGDTRPASLDGRTVACPFCNAKVELLAAALGKDMQCSQCGRRVHVLDDTISLRAKPGRKIGAFELVRRLGAGQFGEVWLARDTHLRRDVAIKLPRRAEDDAHTAELFLREARAAARLRHPSIVPVHEAGFDDGQVYIVTAYIAGITLRERMNKHHFPPEEAARLCQTLAEALHHAHESGIIHRDLKPGNVLLDLQGAPHIADFGLAKHSSINELTITAEGLMLGTPGYMPPEQARGTPDQVTPASDVYSLGVMLYELLTGQRPFDGAMGVLLYRIQTEEPVAPRKLKPQVPRDLETICLKALAKRPADRYGTAQEMAEDLGRYLQHLPIRARPTTLLERYWRWTRRNAAGIAIAALIGVTITSVAILLGAGTVGRNADENRESPNDSTPGHGISTDNDVKLVDVILEIHQTTSFPLVQDAEDPNLRPAESVRVTLWPISARTGQIQYDRAVHLEGVPPFESQLAPGEYFIVADVPGFNFHEVYRNIPQDDQKYSAPEVYVHRKWRVRENGKVEVPRIIVPPPQVVEGMVRFAAASEAPVGAAGSSQWPLHRRSISEFHLDATELRVADYAAVFGGALPYELAANPPPPGVAITFVTYDAALACAEALGKRMPTEFEYERAATLGRKPQFHLEQEFVNQSWEAQLAGIPAFDRVGSEPVVFGLYSNVLEWTSSPPSLYPGQDDTALALPPESVFQRVVRGGPFSAVRGEPSRSEKELGPQQRGFLLRKESSARLGFRCARSAEPHLTQFSFGNPKSTD